MSGLCLDSFLFVCGYPVVPEPFIESYYVLRRIETISVYSEEGDQDDKEALNYAKGEQA